MGSKPATRAEREPPVVCPLCRSTEGRDVPLRVSRTSADAAANAVARQRRCPECRATVSTVEQVVAVRPAGVKAAPLVVSTADGR